VVSETSSQPPAHVVYVLPVLHPAGAERIVAELAKRIAARGYTTSVICLEDDQALIGRELTDAGVAVTGLHLSRRRTLRCAAALAGALPSSRPLIVHAHLFHANLAARLAIGHLAESGRRGVHVLSTVHIAERRFRPWQFLLDRFTAKMAEAEICVSPFVATFHQQRTGLPEAFFPVIENGIDLGRFTPDPSRVPLAGNSRRVLSVGRLDRQKDFPTLLRAWPQISAAFPEATLSIAGDGPEKHRLLRLRSSLKLRGVEFLGHVKDIPGLLRQADLYVQPSAWEGLPLTVVEAMACRLPIIVTSADSLPDMICDGVTGLIVPKHDSPALAAAVLSLLKDPVRAQRFATAAHAEALRRFSLDRMIGDYAAFYESILSGQGKP
jgi:glycosyltransferase involved in cell wall biosynthesis